MAHYDEVTTESYRGLFSVGEDPVSQKTREAFKVALENRRFEIDLYWRRSTYFWAFVAVSFGGYFALSSHPSDHIWSRLVVAVLGMTFSYSWHLITRASKFWQENWERHIDALENEITGPLYKTIKRPQKNEFYFPFRPYPLSVSRINMVLTIFVTLSWYPMMSFSLYKVFLLRTDVTPMISFLLPALWLAFLTSVYFAFCRTDIQQDPKSKSPTTVFIMRRFPEEK